MTVNLSNLFPDVLRTIDSSTFTGSYQQIGTALTYPTRIIKIYNGSSVAITISWDGINDHEYLPVSGFILLDVSTNKQSNFSCQISAGTSFFVKAASGSGLVYLSTYYAKR